ncbi:hypothetical protein KS4_29820 [Poriferisphaera corsica]|uniref:Uncharacterized protein n=1 Tax=Poriferisphaera corsica TaxID=2528020 RepID=A0A517YXF0_9BACT|nr:hypothetical protein KS4_29820 [Poriferisphaera corsica]
MRFRARDLIRELVWHAICVRVKYRSVCVSVNEQIRVCAEGEVCAWGGMVFIKKESCTDMVRLPLFPRTPRVLAKFWDSLHAIDEMSRQLISVMLSQPIDNTFLTCTLIGRINLIDNCIQLAIIPPDNTFLVNYLILIARISIIADVAIVKTVFFYISNKCIVLW